MIKVKILISLLVCSVVLSAQKNDYNWLTGYGGYPHPIYDPYNDCYFATSRLNFNYDSLQVSYDSLQMNFSRTNINYSDSTGNLLFYSNGIYVANALDEKIVNSDSLNAGWLQYVWDTSIQHGGYRNFQGMLAIQDVSLPDHYYLLHTLSDKDTADHLYNPELLVTYLDMSANNGHGIVLYKNRILIDDSVNGIGEELSAVKHGNGRDWWILAQKRNSNCYYRILLDQTGPHVLDELTCGGFVMSKYDVGSCCFSPDGATYVYQSFYDGLNIYSFDRCIGELNNVKTLALPVAVDSSWLARGVAISPNNRFLYLSLTKNLYQFDLLDTDMFIHIDTVGIYDGWHLTSPSYVLSIFNSTQLAPNGKIYINCGNTIPAYHVINNPDFKGDSCNFVQRGQPLAGYSNNNPNFPNYRLGREIGSACDTLWSNTDEITIQNREKILKVFPNPATDLVTVDYGYTDWSKPGKVSLEIVNELGQMVYEQNLPQYSGYQKLDVTKYAIGMYTTFIKRSGNVIAAQKFAKE